jgi:uracil-DNA glycosylase family 4
MAPTLCFDQNCRHCPRLATFLDTVKQQQPHYHARPVAPFGDANAQLLIVGLAPGMHGANASGRPFTGDYAGLLLYETLYTFGYSNQPVSESLVDPLTLTNCRITNAVKCLPPQNKPTTAEIGQCNRYLAAEIETLPKQAVILALGTIAHQAVLKAYQLKISRTAFGHRAQHPLPDGRTLVDSYHTSRYNIQTKRLTQRMFHDVFVTIGEILTHYRNGNPAIGMIC